MQLRVEREGYDAYMRGATLDANPYPNEREVDDLPHGAWTKGWHEGEAVMGRARQIHAPPAPITLALRKGQR